MNARRSDLDERFEGLRVPPQSIEAEQAVIGGLMLDPAGLARIGDVIEERDFYRRDHRLIFRGILELSEKNKPYDAVTLGEWFQANALTEQVGGNGYLIELASTTPSAANILAYAEIVSGKAVLRRLIEAGTDIVNAGFTPNNREADDVVADAQQKLSEVLKVTGKGALEPPKKALIEWFEGMRQRWDSDEWMTGLSTPFAGMDEITFGLQDGDLIIAAARPGMGKTVFGMNAACHVADHHGPVAVFSLEMGRKQLLQRQIAAMAGVPHEWLRSPKAYERKHDHVPTDEYWSKVNVAIQKISSIPLFIDDSSGLTIDQIVARTRQIQQKLKLEGKRLRLIKIDHIHIIAIPGRDPVNEIGVISRKLKGLAKEMNCPVLALAQLNRGPKDRKDKRPSMDELRASGAIEQDADEIWFLYREDYYDKKTHLKRVVELICGKNRNAPVGETIYLRNCFHQMRLEDWKGDLPEANAYDPAANKPSGFRKRGRDAAAGEDT